MKVQEALTHVMQDVREVRKKERNTHQNFNFRGIDTVMNAVGPALRKHGVVIMPEVLEHNLASKPNAKGGTVNYCDVKVKYVVHGPDGDTLSGITVAEANDYGDKATAKALSVAYKYFLLQALCLPTDDVDPDAETFVTERPRQTGVDWQARYAEALQKGPEPFKAFIKWAQANNAPAEMVAAGLKQLGEGK